MLRDADEVVGALKSAGRATSRAKVELVRDVLRLSFDALVNDPRELAGQVMGRVGRMGRVEEDGDLWDAAMGWVRDATTAGGLRVLTPTKWSAGLVEAGTALKRVLMSVGGVTALAMSGDGSVVVSVSGSDANVRVWDVATGEVRRVLVGHTGNVVACAVGVGVVVTAAQDSTVRVWDVSTGDVRRVLHLDMAKGVVPTSVGVSEDGTRVVVGSDDKVARVMRIGAPGTLPVDEVVRVVEGHNAGGLAMTRDGMVVVVGGESNSLRVVEVDSGNVVGTLRGHASHVFAVAVEPVDGGLRVVSGSIDNTARVWDVSRDGSVSVRVLAGHTRWVRSVAMSRDGKRVVTGSFDRSARVYSARAGGEWVLDGVLEGHTREVEAVGVVGDAVVTGGADKTIRVWDARLVGALGADVGDAGMEHHTSNVESVAVARNGRVVVSGAQDDTARVWDAATGKVVRVLRGHTRGVSAVGVSPDGSVVATGSFDTTVRVYWLGNGGLGEVTRELVLTGHTSTVVRLVVTKALVVVSKADDDKVLAWDVSSTWGEAHQVVVGRGGEEWELVVRDAGEASADDRVVVRGRRVGASDSREGDFGKGEVVGCTTDMVGKFFASAEADAAPSGSSTVSGQVVAWAHDKTVCVWSWM